jgi:hypothetical protein
MAEQRLQQELAVKIGNPEIKGALILRYPHCPQGYVPDLPDSEMVGIRNTGPTRKIFLQSRGRSPCRKVAGIGHPISGTPKNYGFCKIIL